ncbi:leucine-rich repeat receptor-like protein kinase family protein [Striga asiatica]|uniref:Leucine-rich repeat receptor-like protein kinase family protein n=1 Tax=Striga asiatica TaxID=4170 RepID=A0A5A7P7H0_STRAF|nr:leucine-rich repeat receptor-like protein kinase family protein [Striga asiatica]
MAAPKSPVSIILLIIIISTKLTISLAQSQSNCWKSDRDALMAFKNAISTDTTASLSTWTNASDPCSGGWVGVVCHPLSGRVTQLTLQNPTPTAAYMEGSLSPSLADLSYLETLLITGMKRITGTIPQAFFRLSRLTTLVLDDNALSGPLPPTLPTKLNALSLSGNRFTARIPSLSLFTNLSTLSLSRNLFIGQIPPLPPTLQFLDLSFNSLSGPITILGVNRLTNLVLTGNRLSGPIPESIFRLPHLSELSIDHNQLTGNIPPKISALTTLAVLRLSNNKLTGRIPASLSQLNNLWDLNLSRNSLIGPLPVEFDKGLPSLSSLDLSFNKFSLKSVPNWIKDRKTLTDVRLASCGLQGPLPVFANPDILTTVDLSSNGFTGTEISNFLQRMPYLNSANLSHNLLRADVSTIRLPAQISVLDLSSNGLSGSLSRLLTTETRKFVQVLDLSRNDISGIIPEFRSGLGLEVLNLAGNKISGPIPDSISRVTGLERLDISRNRVMGQIPMGLGKLHNLQWLDLSNNGLSGPIPASWAANATLKHLSLRNNRLSGSIPQFRPFNVFPKAAYSGNKGLCGKPLPLCKAH